MRVILLLATMGFTLVAAEPPVSEERAFLAEVNASMERMHSGMSAPPTGNVDADYVAWMVPHHQGAIDMAQMQLRYGHNEQLRRISQEIIVAQQQEIVAMKHSLNSSIQP